MLQESLKKVTNSTKLTSKSSFTDFDLKNNLSKMRLSINKKSIGFIESDNTSVKQAEFLIVITSEVPFFPLYSSVLDIFYLMVQLRRKKYYPQFKTINDFLRDLDFKNIIHVLQNKTHKIMKKLAVNWVDFHRDPIHFKFKNIKSTFSFPMKINAKYEHLIPCFRRICQKVKFQNFLLVMTAILLEFFVVFVHPSRRVLSDLIYFFSHAIKPYQVAYNIIYFLPDKKLDFLKESFQQLIVGCLMPKRVFQSRVNLKNTTKKERLVYFVETDEVEFTHKIDRVKPKLEGPKIGFFEKLKITMKRGRGEVENKRRSLRGEGLQDDHLWKCHEKTIENCYEDLRTYLWGCQNTNEFMKLTFDASFFAAKTTDFLQNLEFKLKNLVRPEWVCFLQKLDRNLSKSQMGVPEYLDNLQELHDLRVAADPPRVNALEHSTGLGKCGRAQLQMVLDTKYSCFLLLNKGLILKYRELIEKRQINKVLLKIHSHNERFLEMFMETLTYKYFVEKNIRWYLISSRNARFEDLNDLRFRFYYSETILLGFFRLY